MNIDQIENLKSLGLEINEGFSLQDILEKLPKSIKGFGELVIYPNPDNLILWTISYCSDNSEVYHFYQNTNLLEAAYEMLVWCLENGYGNKNFSN